MRVLSLKDLQTRKGLPYSRVHIERLVREGKFPAPIHLSKMRIAFIEEEVDNWLRARIAERDSAAA